MIGAPRKVFGSDLGTACIGVFEHILYWYFRLCWLIVSPLVILVVSVGFVYGLVTGSWNYPVWVGDVSVLTIHH